MTTTWRQTFGKCSICDLKQVFSWLTGTSLGGVREMASSPRDCRATWSWPCRTTCTLSSRTNAWTNTHGTKSVNHVRKNTQGMSPHTVSKEAEAAVTSTGRTFQMTIMLRSSSLQVFSIWVRSELVSAAAAELCRLLPNCVRDAAAAAASSFRLELELQQLRK